MNKEKIKEIVFSFTHYIEDYVQENDIKNAKSTTEDLMTFLEECYKEEK